MKKLNDANENIKSLKTILKVHSNQSISELSEIISNTKDSRAFVFLLDKINTDKELTRDVLEDFIIYTYDFNNLIIDELGKNQKTGFKLSKFINFNNIKTLLILALLIGITISVASSAELTKIVLLYFGVK